MSDQNNVYAHAEVVKFNEFTKSEATALMDKFPDLPQAFREEMEQLLDASVEDIGFMDTATKLEPDEFKEWYESLHYKDQFKVQDVIKLKLDLAEDHDFCIDVKGADKRAKLEEFLTTEIYPHYNDQVEYLKMF